MTTDMDMSMNTEPLPDWAQPAYDSPLTSVITEQRDPTDEEMAWFGGFYDNCGIVTNYADYPRLIFTHKSPPVLRRLEFLTHTTAWFQTTRSVTGRIMMTGRPSLNQIIALSDYIYVREADVKLAREIMSPIPERVTQMSGEELIEVLIANSGTLHRGGKPRPKYVEWYYSRFRKYTPPPDDESTFWSYVAGVLESRTDIAAVKHLINQPLPLKEVIWLTRRWLCDRYGLGEAVADVLGDLPVQHTLDVIERIWPYTAIGAEGDSND